MSMPACENDHHVGVVWSRLWGRARDPTHGWKTVRTVTFVYTAVRYSRVQYVCATQPMETLYMYTACVYLWSAVAHNLSPLTTSTIPLEVPQGVAEQSKMIIGVRYSTAESYPHRVHFFFALQTRSLRRQPLLPLCHAI